MTDRARTNHELRITLHGRKDRHNEDYYLATPSIPCTVDLSRAVLLFFPAEEQDELDGTSIRDHFSGELVIKMQKTKDELEAGRNGDDRSPRRTRRSRPEAVEGGVE
jgi:hypothetical protein